MTVQVCPECRAGKHRNCDGTSWDAQADAPAPCPCDSADHILLGVAYPEGATDVAERGREIADLTDQEGN